MVETLISVFTIVTTVPLLKDLCEHITPKYAVHWKLIGTLLGLSNDSLNIIEADNFFRVIPCCNDMFGQWLKLRPSASWNMVFTAIESNSMYKARALHKGNQFGCNYEFI